MERFLLGGATSDSPADVAFFSSTGYGSYGNYCISSFQVACHYLTDCDVEADLAQAGQLQHYCSTVPMGWKAGAGNLLT